MSHQPILLIHGGAGVAPRAELSDDTLHAAQQGLHAALAAGGAVLAGGGSALDAVQAAVRVMEDDPTFNAGIGGTLTSAGHVEHDAAIMDGSTRLCGAVAGLRRIASPINLARAVMQHSPHVLLIGSGAEAFAQERGMELVDPGIFITERRVAALRRVQAEQAQLAVNDEDRHGTVGAVALDAQGHLAAATSTGGMTNKRPGRVGDSPVIGAGTYAHDATVAVSGTGHGEYFLRTVFAHRVASLVELAGLTPDAANEQALAELAQLGGSGGAIVLARDGAMSLRFNSSGMYRGWWRVGAGAAQVAVY